jgi:adenosylcobinamide kinase / adenosylcobinamide-phosphate guanylyltransferase
VARPHARTFHRARAARREAMITLVLGGARSGKSRMAESLCAGERHYIATAQAFDDEMRQRIAQHRVDRGSAWVTHEAPLDLLGALRHADGAGRCVLVDCLTLWLSNQILAEHDWDAALHAVLQHVPQMNAELVFVSNEVGLGIVPDNALARRFRDAQGITNQRVAALADRVVFMAAGLPMVLKGSLR